MTGPDEYSCLVNNNYYTNLSVKYHLQHTITLCNLLKDSYPDMNLQERFGLTDTELTSFEAASKAMYLPYDKTLGIYAQDDSFLKQEWVDLPALGKDALPMLLH